MDLNGTDHFCKFINQEANRRIVTVPHIDLALPGKPDPVSRKPQGHGNSYRNSIQQNLHENGYRNENISLNGQPRNERNALGNKSIKTRRTGEHKPNSNVTRIDRQNFTAESDKLPLKFDSLSTNLKCNSVQFCTASADTLSPRQTNSRASSDQNVSQDKILYMKQESENSQPLSPHTKCTTPEELYDEVSESFCGPDPMSKSEWNITSDKRFPVQLKDSREMFSKGSFSWHKRSLEISKMTGSNGPAVRPSVSTRTPAGSHLGRPNSCHKYLTATDLNNSVFHQADLTLGQPTKTSLLRIIKRENGAFSSKASNQTLDEELYDDIEEIRTRSEGFSSSKTVTRMLTGMIPEGESLHSFLTGGKYNRYCSRDSDEYLTIIGKQILEQTQETHQHVE